VETGVTQLEPGAVHVDRGLVYGVIAEFDDAPALIEAAGRARAEGYRSVEAYTPFPVEGLSEALGHRDHFVPFIMLGGGFLGALSGFSLLAWTTVIDYPLNIGGRPLFGWPSWIPITFEMTVLLAAISGIVGMFALNGLPMPYHPVFDARNFDRATSDRFFLCVEATDPKFNRVETREFLESLGALHVSEVELRK
jgi:hypothetical protein